MRFAPVECAQRRRASRRVARDNLSLRRNGQGNPCAKCDKSPEFRKSFPHAGGQCRYRQRIVRMREYSTRIAASRGRAFDSNTAAASTGSSGSWPLLHSVHLPSSVDNHAAGAIGGKQRCKSASLWHAEAGGIRFFHERAGLPQAQQRCQSSSRVDGGLRSRLSARLARAAFKVCGEGCQCLGFAGSAPQEQCRDEARACPSDSFCLTAASIADTDRAAFR